MLSAQKHVLFLPRRPRPDKVVYGITFTKVECFDYEKHAVKFWINNGRTVKAIQQNCVYCKVLSRNCCNICNIQLCVCYKHTEWRRGWPVFHSVGKDLIHIFPCFFTATVYRSPVPSNNVTISMYPACNVCITCMFGHVWSIPSDLRPVMKLWLNLLACQKGHMVHAVGDESLVKSQRHAVRVRFRYESQLSSEVTQGAEMTLLSPL